MNSTCVKRREGLSFHGMLPGIVVAIATMLFIGAMATGTVYGKADNFTDIFYTNSFRGAFEWVQKLDWVGMIVQVVISTFSLFGVALLVIRIMTSMLFLSAKGLWEEVHDLKSSGESAEKDFLGMFGMAKTWASGKSGTGLDAIIGAVMLLLPDVKRYSDFGEKAGGDFGEDITISQYMLKIALPTVMTVFFFAMGFNGTLFQALAVTVDMMGSFADHAVSVNYAGIVDDLVNSNRGFKFTFDADGTKLGKTKQAIAKSVYGGLVGELGSEVTPEIMYNLGNHVQQVISEQLTYEKLGEASGVAGNVKNGLASDAKDSYVNYVECSVVTVTGEGAVPPTALAGLEFDKNELLGAQGLVSASDKAVKLYVCGKQSKNYNGTYFNGLGGDGGVANGGGSESAGNTEDIVTG